MTLTSFISIIVSAVLFYGFYHLNDWLFKAFELHTGANWIFLPAGLRLTCTLLFGLEGAIGLLIAALLLVHFNLALDPITGIVSALISSFAPYLVYVGALRTGMSSTLESLSAALLGVLSLVYALANSLLHSFWFLTRGIYTHFLHNWITMFIGDLLGTLIILYTLKTIDALYRRRPRQST